MDLGQCCVDVGAMLCGCWFNVVWMLEQCYVNIGKMFSGSWDDVVWMLCHCFTVLKEGY